MQSLYDWIQEQMKVLSRHSDTAKTFAYLLKQWDALNLYCSNGWAEIDNNIAENARRGVALGRKNWLFAGSDAGGECAAVLYSLIGTCQLNGVEPEAWLRYVLGHIHEKVIDCQLISPQSWGDAFILFTTLRYPSVTGGRLSHQHWLNGYIRRWVYASPDIASSI